MDGETTQPTRISKDEYIKFKQFVQDVHGKTRGHLSTEIENALREYRQEDKAPDSITRIEDDIATIKAQLAADADGGSVATPPTEPDTHAHAEDNDNTDKPPANSPRLEKLQWLIDEHYNRDGGSTKPSQIQTKVKEAYGFEDRTAEKFIQPFVNDLDAKRHPNNPSVIVWGSEIDRIKGEDKT